MAESAERVSRSTRFVQRLQGALADRATMAALRRGLGKPTGQAPEMHAFVLPWLSTDEPPWSEDSYYLIASLFAYWHQGLSETSKSAPENLGASLSRLRNESDSVEKRFVALLNCHADDLPPHLRYTVGLLRTKDIPVDWLQLLNDIRHWNSESRWVQRHWARSFWRVPQEDEER